MRFLLNFLLTVLWIGANAQQSGCGLAWLQKEAAHNVTVPFDDYLDTDLPKLHYSGYFTLHSDNDYSVTMKLEQSKNYTLLFYTGNASLASGLEITDATKHKIAFVKSYGKSDNNWNEAEYKPGRTATYTVTVRSVFKTGGKGCGTILVREWDDDDWDERQPDDDD